MAVALVPVCAGRRGRQLVTSQGQADQKQKDRKEWGYPTTSKVAHLHSPSPTGNPCPKGSIASKRTSSEGLSVCEPFHTLEE